MTGHGRRGAEAPPTDPAPTPATAARPHPHPHPLDAVFATLARRQPYLRLTRAGGDGAPPPDDRPRLSELCADAEAMRALLERPRRWEPRLQPKGLTASLVITAASPLSTLAAACLVGAGVAPRLGAGATRFAVVAASATTERDPVHLDLLDPAFDVEAGDVEAGRGPFAAHPDARPAPDREALRDRMREELEAFLGPLIEAAHRLTRLSRRAMWRLAGDAVAGEFLEVGRALGREEAARADALGILKRPGAPMTNPQMRFLEAEVRDPARPDAPPLRRAFRARGGCCLWKDLPGAALCTTCVLRPEAEMRAIVEAGLRRRLVPPPAGAGPSAEP